MRLRHQALIVAGCCCLASGGCARLLGALIAPQQTAMSTAGSVANTAMAPAHSELVGLGHEVDRLLAGRDVDEAELERIKQALDRRIEEPGKSGAAQDDPERLRPWHPRAPAEPYRLGPKRSTGDQLRMGLYEPERGLAAHGPLPDGIAAGDLRKPLDLTPVRILPKR